MWLQQKLELRIVCLPSQCSWLWLERKSNWSSHAPSFFSILPFSGLNSVMGDKFFSSSSVQERERESDVDSWKVQTFVHGYESRIWITNEKESERRAKFVCERKIVTRSLEWPSSKTKIPIEIKGSERERGKEEERGRDKTKQPYRQQPAVKERREGGKKRERKSEATTTTTTATATRTEEKKKK